VKGGDFDAIWDLAQNGRSGYSDSPDAVFCVGFQIGGPITVLS